MRDLPAGWAWATIGDLVDVLDSRRVPVNAKERAERPGDVPYYGATGQVGWIDEALFDEELVLLGEDGAPFLNPSKPKAYLISGRAWVNNHAHVLRARFPVTTNAFLKHALDTADFGPHVTGTTRLKLNQKAMRSMVLPLPPAGEQERIVAAIEAFLSRLDAAKAELVTVTAKLNTLLESSLAESFGTQPRMVRLGEVAMVGSGATPKRTDSRYWEGGSVPWVTSGALNESVVTQPSGLITETAVFETSVKVWPMGTVLVAMYGEGRTRGKAAELAIDATCNQACAAIQPDPTVLQPRYLRWFLNSQYHQNRRLASGGVQPNLSLGLIKSMCIPVPSLSDQDRIVRVLQVRLDTIERLQDQVAVGTSSAAGLRRSILAAAFSGQLVPQDPDDEPASVLLDRIRAERTAAGAR